MRLRYARHTTNLKGIEQFYTDIVGLEKLGGFENHSEYNGIFLGHQNQSWHLEFTVSGNAPGSKSDEDDMLVFYCRSDIELLAIRKKLNRQNVTIEIPRNPYWKENGIMVSDPDGYKVVFAMQDVRLTNEDELTKLVHSYNIDTWDKLLNSIRKLPYGRNRNREDFGLVVTEQQGTCSSKHALLKKMADLNGIENVKLIIGMYKMNHINTPKIGSLLMDRGLTFVPEAHCYLKIDNRRIDITAVDSEIGELMDDVLVEKEIEAEQVTEFKVLYHKDYLKTWLKQQNLKITFEALWELREQCIERLSK